MAINLASVVWATVLVLPILQNHEPQLLPAYAPKCLIASLPPPAPRDNAAAFLVFPLHNRTAGHTLRRGVLQCNQAVAPKMACRDLASSVSEIP